MYAASRLLSAASRCWIQLVMCSGKWTAEVSVTVRRLIKATTQTEKAESLWYLQSRRQDIDQAE